MDNVKDYKSKIEKSILKKAFGYNYKEVIDEFAIEGKNKTLIKRKITTKNVPPDLSAVKMLLDDINCEEKDYSNLSDEQLVEEIKKALEKLDYINYEKKHANSLDDKKT